MRTIIFAAAMLLGSAGLAFPGAALETRAWGVVNTVTGPATVLARQRSALSQPPQPCR